MFLADGKVMSFAVAEDRYRALFDNAHDAIALLSPEGVILEANHRWEDVLGIPAGQLLGRHIGELASPGEESANLREFRRAVEQRGSRAHLAHLRRADGATVHMELNTTLVDLDGSPSVLAVGRDVSERIRAAEALADAQQNYRLIVEQIPDAIWTADERGHIVFVTPNITKVCGCGVADLGGEDIDRRCERIHPDDRARVRDAYLALFATGKPFDVEYRRELEDGRWRWLRDRSFATFERDGRRYAQGMMSDITERRRLEEGLQQSQKMEAVGQLSGGIAHDFNNILAVVLANSHFLLEQLGQQDPRREDANEIKLAAERGATLTRQLLAFSRRQVLEPTVLDLNQVVKGIEKMIRRLIGEDVELCSIPGAELGAARADVGQIEQVLMNLVVNARDAMPRGGRLIIETANVELDESQVAAHPPVVAGRYVMVAVSDTGSGMTAEIKRRLFEPFFTTKEKGRGTGLGLSTCYGIVKQSGGFIWVNSEPGQGSVFKVYLPRVEETSDDQRKRSVSRALSGDEKVLLIEDDAGVRVAVTRMLEAKGYQVVVARDGEEALLLAERHAGDIDLIVSDVVMPGRSGPEVVDELRGLARVRKALFMSGYTDHEVMRNGTLQEGTNFLQKPFAPGTLAKKVREILDS